MSYFSLLTDDLLARVLDKLAGEGDRKAWRLVCKDFLRVDSLHRATLRVLRPEFLPSLLRKFGNLEVLDLSVCPRIDDGVVGSLLGRAESPSWTRRVRSLVLSRTTGLRSAGLGSLVRSCSRLESVDVSYSWGFGDREAAALSCAGGLRALKLDKCLDVTDIGLAKIAVGCSKLERLSVKWCLEISDLGIDLLCKKCLDLKSLDISYLKVTNGSLRSIASLQKLESLAMVGCSSVDDVGLHFLGNGCPSLLVLDVLRCDGLSLSGLISVIRGHNGLLRLNMGYCCAELSPVFIHLVNNLKCLNSIRVDGARVSDPHFLEMSNNGKCLVEIGLSKCMGVTDIGIMQLVSSCVNLKILDLTCCHSITDVAIAAIARSCRNLCCLMLESCNQITEKSLDWLGSYCSRLEKLDLTECYGINDRGLNYLSRCSELLCLKLGLCANISDKGLFYIASNCSKLRELDLYRKLEKLNLSYCNDVTDNGMEHISHLKELSDLELRGLLNITSEGLTAIAYGCRRLSELELKHCENINDLGFWALAYYSQNLRQINVSCCAISNVGLCMVMGNLTRLLDAKLVHLNNVSVEGFEVALMACCTRLKKLKLHSSLMFLLSPEIIQTLQVRGCKIRWD